MEDIVYILIVINSSLFYFQFYILWLIIIVNYSLFVEQTVLYKLNTVKVTHANLANDQFTYICVTQEKV